MIFSGPILTVWLIKHWQDIVIGVVVVACASFFGAFLLRGAKIERLEQEKRAVVLELETDLKERDIKLEDAAEEITELNDSNKALRLASELADAMHQEAMADALEVNTERTRGIEHATQEAVSAIRRADTCEEKRDALLKLMSEVRP